jgi:hypothetical protein
LVQVVATWGNYEACQADLTDYGVVGIADSLKSLPNGANSPFFRIKKQVWGE